jgi:hypothetical protein
MGLKIRTTYLHVLLQSLSLLFRSTGFGKTGITSLSPLWNCLLGGRKEMGRPLDMDIIAS